MTMITQTLPHETIALPQALTIRTVQTTRDQLLTGLSAAQAVVIDIPADAEVDLSFIQLIEAARMSAQTNGQDLTLRSAAAGGVLSTLERSGFLTDMDPSARFFWLHER
ncbi:STAS domain-containing protein [Agrobacterium vitis]|uniref:STAS domain-containing protein n=2 Tax=Agrobacterium vitis TaxID=373 RepID=A0A6L6V9E0_AGRVI|nr:STAS domain-containing protein [Agrobacterium vitis]